MIHGEDFNSGFSGFEPQSELLLHGSEEGRACRIRSGYAWCYTAKRVLTCFYCKLQAQIV
jgi:hypothetical protein